MYAGESNVPCSEVYEKLIIFAKIGPAVPIIREISAYEKTTTTCV